MTLILRPKPVALDPRRRAFDGAKVEEFEPPPIRQPHFAVETRSPERIKLSEELAVLNRPLEEEVEYYDPVPRSRAKPVVAVVMVLALGGAGYSLLAQRHRAADDHAADRSMRQGEQVSAIGAPRSASAGNAVVPTKAPATEPVPTPAPVAPIAPGPTAEAGSSTSGTPGELEPEGDPPPPAARGSQSHASRN
jgi:hypothetical protein